MSDTIAENPLDTALDALIDREPVLLRPDLEPEALHRFIEDVAQKIAEPKDIAARYGFLDETQMYGYIRDTAEVRRRIKVRRSIWESDGAVEERLRKYSGHVLLESLPEIGAILTSKVVSAATKNDFVKTFARMAGVDGASKADQGTPGSVGGRFSVNIMFSSGKVEKITTVENEPTTLEVEAS